MTNGQFPLSGTSEPMTRQTGSTRSFLVRSTSLRRRYGAVGQRWDDLGATPSNRQRLPASFLFVLFGDIYGLLVLVTCD